MRIQDLKRYEGQVVTFDLIMGREITTRVQEVNLDYGVVICSKPRVFVPVPNPQNPSQATVVCLHYGHPMYQADELLTVDAGHIFTVFEPNEDQKTAYAKETSGLIAGGASFSKLSPEDVSKLKGGSKMKH